MDTTTDNADETDGWEEMPVGTRELEICESAVFLDGNDRPLTDPCSSELSVVIVRSVPIRVIRGHCVIRIIA
jgi:hypothetical protein